MRLPRANDPGRQSLRTAARAAIVVPTAFALGTYIVGDAQAGLFAAFGCFAPTALANFGGPPGSRALAYAVSAILGAALITLGTALSGHVIAATAAAFALVFAIRIAGVFGGHIERSAPMLTLAFLIAVTTYTPVVALNSRLAGWLVGGVLAAIGSLWLWPRYERSRITRKASDLCRVLAAAVRDATRAPGAERAADEFSRELATVPFRPAGPSELDRALAGLLEELVRLAGYLRAPAREADDARLASMMAATLEVVAARLAGGRAMPDLMALERERADHGEAIAARAADALRRGISAEEVLGRLDGSFQLRVASYVVLSIAANAMIMTGAELPPAEAFEVPPEAPETSGLTELVRTAGRQLRAELSLSAARLQDAVRGAAGIAIATSIALSAGVSHAFWIVLGTLAAMRSSALGTGRTALETILGTALGVAIGASLLLAIGTDKVLEWIALPITVFLAAYTPSAIHFIAGKAAFTLFVLVLLDLVDPIGWEVGLLRIEHVAIGAGVSLAVGMLLWPHGSRKALRRSAAQAYDAAAAYLARGIAAVGTQGAALRRAEAPTGRSRSRPRLSASGGQPMDEMGFTAGRGVHVGPARVCEEAPGRNHDLAVNTQPAPDRSVADRAALIAAIRRSSDALRQQLAEPGHQLPPSTWGALLAAPRHVRAAGDSLRRIAQRYPAVERASWPAGFQAAADRVIAHYRELAHALSAGSAGSTGCQRRIRTRGPGALGAGSEVRLEAGFAAARSQNRPDTSDPVDRVTRPGAAAAIESWRAAPEDPGRRNATLRLVWTRNWLIWLDALASEVTDAAEDVAASTSAPWWQQ